MSLSTTCKEQQQKERQTLKMFVSYSLFYSVLLHASVLVLAINGIWDREPELASDDPIEIVFVEDLEPLPEEAIEEPEPIETTVTQPQEIVPEAPPEQVIQEPVESSPESPSVAEAIEPPPKLEQPELVAPPEPVAEPSQPEAVLAPEPVAEIQPEPLEPDSFSEPLASERSAPPEPVVAVTAGIQPSIVQSNPVASFSQPSNFSDSISSPDAGESFSPITSERSAPPRPVAPTQPRDLGEIASNYSNPETSSSGPPAEVGTQPSFSQSTSGFGDSFGGIGSFEGFSGNSDNPGSDELASIGSPLQSPGSFRQRPSRPSPSPPPRDSSENEGWGRNSGGNGWGSNSGLNGVECLDCPQPRYPARARREGWQGNPRLRIDTDDRGYVTNVSLEESSGHSILDEAAMEAVRDWKLEPKEGGRWGVTVTLKFELD
jgi:TonB family protein